MAENIRLIIWDLDETFWKGTVTEGGHRYDRSTHDAVIELARRGIMSSICSKNDFDSIRAILVESGIWEYFIFPSINWEPKGQRIKKLVEDVQLRPETVLFIDDNHLNLKEALHHVPSLQVAGPEAIPGLLDNPLLKGKDDSGLSRLKQYKLLETRKADLAEYTQESNEGHILFLRESGIKVRFDYNVETNLDRAIELINRTNQLNFTKRRLPENEAAARETFLEQIARYDTQVGLVHVSDKYGDYGYCGLFQIISRRGETRLVHFCFSCRILNMGVEAWVYQRLGKPMLRIVGEVLSNPLTDPEVDWITHVVAGPGESEGAGPTEYKLSSVAARGGCTIWPLVNYFQMHAPTVVSEYNIVRNGNRIALDHSICLRQAVEGVSDEAVASIGALGYTKDDFKTNFLDHDGERPIWIFSSWWELHGGPIYRHKGTGMMVPFSPNGPELDPKVVDYVESEFSRVAFNLSDNIETLKMVLTRIPSYGKLFVLVPPKPESGKMPGLEQRRPKYIELLNDLAAQHPNLIIVDFDNFIVDPSEIHGKGNHFDRQVYHRVFERMIDIALNA